VAPGVDPVGFQHSVLKIGIETNMSTTPTSNLLRADHRRMEAELDRLLFATKRRGTDMVLELRRAFSALQCLSEPHFRKEENVFYPYLRAQFPELLSHLDEQHEHARELERNLLELLESIDCAPDMRQQTELIRFAAELYDVIQHHIVDEEDQLCGCPIPGYRSKSRPAWPET
jgi:hemerythrin-like domain-containing protein